MVVNAYYFDTIKCIQKNGINEQYLLTYDKESVIGISSSESLII